LDNLISYQFWIIFIIIFLF